MEYKAEAKDVEEIYNDCSDALDAGGEIIGRRSGDDRNIHRFCQDRIFMSIL